MDPVIVAAIITGAAGALATIVAAIISTRNSKHATNAESGLQKNANYKNQTKGVGQFEGVPSSSDNRKTGNIPSPSPITPVDSGNNEHYINARVDSTSGSESSDVRKKSEKIIIPESSDENNDMLIPSRNPGWRDAISQKFIAIKPFLDTSRGEWEVGEGGSGIPGLKFRSDKLPDGRHIVGHVEPKRPPKNFDGRNLKFQYFAGVTIRPEIDFPNVDSITEAPTWVDSLRRLRQLPVLEEVAVPVSKRSGGSAGDMSRRKMDIVREFLPDDLWLGKGYSDWAVGIRSEWLVATDGQEENLAHLARSVEKIIEAWFDAEVSASSKYQS